MKHTTTVQAQRVIDGLKSIGLVHRSTKGKRRDFSVKTKTFVQCGDLYYDSAFATCYNKKARQTVVENISKLKDMGIEVQANGFYIKS